MIPTMSDEAREFLKILLSVDAKYKTGRVKLIPLQNGGASVTRVELEDRMKRCGFPEWKVDRLTPVLKEISNPEWNEFQVIKTVPSRGGFTQVMSSANIASTWDIVIETSKKKTKKVSNYGTIGRRS